MNFFRFCCASQRNENLSNLEKYKFALDPNSNEMVEKKLKKLKNVLVEYIHFERSLGVQNVDIIKLVELVLNIYANNEVPKREL